MKLFLKYIMQYKFVAMIFCVFSCIFAVVFSLYNLQTEAVLYSFVLCAAISIIVLTIHFLHFQRKYLEHQRFIEILH